MSASGRPVLEFTATPRFEMVRFIGSGGMGSVYEAFDRELGARVALKRVDRCEPEQLIRFKREFRDFQNLSHPNLVKLRELFSDGAEWFFSMELLDGVDFLEYVRPSVDAGTACSLADTETMTASLAGRTPTTNERAPRRIRPTRFVPGPLDERRLRLALPQLARGIQALHDAGKLHCDIKPSNVLVTRDGRAVVLDYGVAMDLDEGPRAPRLRGTVAYMAPEQAACATTERAADWYAVGVVLYEALTGRRPHEGTALEILQAKQYGEAPSPRDIEPTAPRDLSALCEDLLKIEPAARPSGAEVLARLGVEASSPPHPRSRHAEFVGRDAHLSTLTTAYQQARERARLVVVYGESGVGKSALVRHFIEAIKRSDPRAIALTGTCYERESVPFKAFDGVIDALGHYLESVSEADAERLIAEHVSLVAHAFPVLWGSRAIRTVASSEIPGAIDPREQRSRLFGAVRHVFRRISEAAPLVVAIDDLQWADADSRTLLEELMAEPGAGALRLLFIVTVRTDDTNAGSLQSSQLGDLVRDAILLPVERLLPDEARVLAECLVRDTPSSRPLDPELIARMAEGHPLLLDALVRHATVVSGASPRQTSLAEALWARIAPLPSDARRVLELVAIASGRIAHDAVSVAAGMPLAELSDHVAALRASHLLATSGAGTRDHVAPYHEQIRRAVLAHIDASAQRDHHRRLAEALQATNHGDPEALAVHWRECGELERAAHFAELAAEKASHALAFARAVHFYELCLDALADGDPRVPRLRVKLADALSNAGRSGEAGDAYLRAANGAGGFEMLELRRRAAEQLLISGRIDVGLATLREVLSTARMNLAETPKRALTRLLWSRARLRLRGLSYKEQDSAAIPAEQLMRIDICWSTSIALALVDSVRGADFQARNLLLSLRAGEPYRVARALAVESGYVAIGGSKTAARTAQLQREAACIAERVGHPHAIGLVKLMSGIAAFLDGKWQESCDRCAEAETIFRDRCTGATWELDNAKLYPLWARIFMGQLGDLGVRASLLLHEARTRGDLYLETNLRTRVLNMSLLADDQPGLARREVEEGIAGWSHQGFHLQNYFALHSRVETALYEGQGALAHQLIEDAWPLLRASDCLLVQLMRIETLALRARCALRAATEDKARAPALWSTARGFASRLLEEKSTWATAFAHLIKATADGRGQVTDGNCSMLLQAQHGFEKAGMRLHAAATMGRLGNGAQAAEVMRSSGVRDVQRMTDLFAPGLRSL